MDVLHISKKTGSNPNFYLTQELTQMVQNRKSFCQALEYLQDSRALGAAVHTPKHRTGKTGF